MTDVSTVSEEPTTAEILQTADLRSSILAIDDIPTEIVVVPEWNNARIEVRGMTGGDRAQMMAAAVEDDGIDWSSMYADIIVKTCYDPATGARIFTDADKGAINGKSGKVVDRLAQVGMALSGMGGDKVVEEQAKDS